ncbi:MAG: isopentenyl transferase family protein [Patescibacteria group bacterium]
MHKLLAVVGPTGSGKTKLAVKLAKKFNGVIVSADSRQIFREMDIGTNKEGKPGKWGNYQARIVDGIPQLLIDVVEPGNRFTVADWLTLARKMLSEIWAAGQLPIVVGGTGLYVTALTEGYQLGGGRFAKNNQPVDFESLILMPEVDRQLLNKKSDQRCVRIFDALMAETEKLLASGVPGDWLDKIGLDYRYAFKRIRGQLSREKAIEQYQVASRAYIRRQITWWRHHGEPITVSDSDEATNLVTQRLSS